MRAIGIRDVKEHASEVLRVVEEKREEVNIVRNDLTVARIVPPRRRMTVQEVDAWNAEADALAKKVALLWSGPRDASEVMAAERER